MYAQRFGYDEPVNEQPSFIHKIARQMAISFLRQPVQTSGLMVMGVASLTIMANALYFQPGMHPAPFFSQKAPQQIAALTPIDEAVANVPLSVSKVMRVSPVLRPNLGGAEMRLASAPEINGRAKTAQKLDLSQPQGNKQAYEVQTLLARLGFFDKKRDGYYGPNTANAIRAFQQANALELTGQLNTELVDQLHTATVGGKIAPTKVLPVPTIPKAFVPMAAVEAPKPVLMNKADTVAKLIAKPDPNIAPGPLELAAILAKSMEEAIPVMGENVASAVSQVAKAVGVEPTTRKVMTRKISNTPQLAVAAPSQPLAQSTLQAMPAPVAVKPAPVEVAAASQPQSQALVENIQRGLLSLGYLHGEVDGVAGDATSAAIREFENYNAFPITGQANAHTLTLLIASKADIS